MKLSSITFPQDGRIQELSVSKLVASDTISLNFEAGIVTVVRTNFEEPPFLIPFARLLCMRPEVVAKEPAPEAKAKKP